MRIAILISGGGSNMKALADMLAIEPSAELALVASDQPKAAGLVWAQEQGFATWAPVDGEKYAENKLIEVLVAQKIDLICLAGFMRLVSPNFLQRWPNRVLNIHPSLLPKYPGLNTHERAIKAGDSEHGCTVHRVDEGMDTGPIIEQARVLIEPDDTAETLAARVLQQEHKLYPRVVKALIAQNRAAQ